MQENPLGIFLYGGYRLVRLRLSLICMVTPKLKGQKEANQGADGILGGD